MHKKALVTDGLSYVQNILQPSFVGPFNVVGPRHLPKCLRHNPALYKPAPPINTYTHVHNFISPQRFLYPHDAMLARYMQCLRVYIRLSVTIGGGTALKVGGQN